MDIFSRIRHADALRCRVEDEGNYLIYCPETDEMHIIGEVEKQIFDLCGDNDFDTVLEQAEPLLAQKGITDLEVGRSELFTFICDLHKRKLVVYE